MDNDYKSHFEVYTVKQDTDETRSLSFDSRRRSRQQIFSEMPFHKFLIVVVGYYTSREISVQCLGAYRLNYWWHKSQEYFEDTYGHHRSIRCVEEVIQKPPWHNAESLIVVGWLEKAFYCLYESSQCWVTMYTDYGFHWNRSTKDRSRSIFHRGWWIDGDRRTHGSRSTYSWIPTVQLSGIE